MKTKHLMQQTTLTVLTLLSASLGSLQIQAQTAASKPEESRNYQVLSEKITESYRDIAKWQFEVSALEKALDEADRREGGGGLIRLPYMTNTDLVATGATSFLGALAFALRAYRSQTTAGIAGNALAAVLLAGFSGELAFSGEIDGKRGSGLFIEVDSKQEKELRDSIERAKAEIEMVKERLVIQAEELNLDVKQIQALAALKDYDATTADVREEGRRAAAKEQVDFYEERPSDKFLHSEKGRH